MSTNSMPPGESSFWSDFVRALRKTVVDSLLAGNDTGCFTTAQYAAAYEKTTHRVMPMRDELARKHLQSLADTVREVSPDVWAQVEEEAL